MQNAMHNYFLEPHYSIKVKFKILIGMKIVTSLLEIILYYNKHGAC